MGFVGLDPAGAGVLADTIDRYATQISWARRQTLAVLQRYPSGNTTAVDGGLSHVESGLHDGSASLRWRARVIEQAESIVGGDVAGAPPGLAWFAATAVFDVDTWQAEFREWYLDSLADWLPTATPREVADAFGRLSRREVNTLVQHHPELVGGLDGAPPDARFAANRILIRAEIRRLRDYLERLRDQAGQIPGLDPRISRALAAYFTERTHEYQSWLDEGRQILLFDPRGDGRVIEVFGDLSSAQHIAVAVPGMANDITNFSTDGGGFRGNAADLFTAVADPSVATIAWLGYDTPDNVGAAVRSAAEAGAPSLQRFLEGIDPHAERHVTVIAHSYGSVLAGTAAGDGIAADNLVFVGSPGTTLDHATDALLRDGGLVWAALADNDVIANAISPSELPPPWVPPALWPIWIGVDRWNGGAEELWHGTNPASDGFGAIEFATDGCHGHSEYYEAGSLENLAKIVRGLYSEVELVDPPPSSGSW